MNRERLSDVLREAREAKRWSAPDISQAIFRATERWIPPSWYNQVESGRIGTPSRERLSLIAKALGLSEDQLFELAGLSPMEFSGVRRIPVYEISAGPGVFATEEVTYIDANEMQDVDVAYRVRGTSMEHVGIQDGSLIYVNSRQSAEIGNDVIAWLPEGTGVVKRLIEQEGKRFLKGNGGDPIPVDEGVILGGVVIGKLLL